MLEKTMNITNPDFTGNANVQGLKMETGAYGLTCGFIVDLSEKYIRFGTAVKKGLSDNTVIAGVSKDDSENYGIAVFNSAIAKNREGSSDKYLSGMPIDIMVDGYMWFRPSDMKGITRKSKVYADKTTGEVSFTDSDNTIELKFCKVVLIGEDKKSVLVKISPIVPVGGGGTEVKLQTKSVTLEDSEEIVPDDGYDGMSSVDVTVVHPTVSLQEKSVSITENGDTAVVADTGYNGLSKVNISVTVGGGGISEYNAKVSMPPMEVPACYNISELDVSNWNTSYTMWFSAMFYNMKQTKRLDLKNFNTSIATLMDKMFEECNNIEVLDLSSFDTQKVTEMNRMFYNCKKLTELNLSSFNTSKVSNNNSMFYGCNELTDVIFGNNWFPHYSISSFDISSASKLSHDSVLDLFNKLATRTNSPTLKLHSSAKARMSEAEIKIATDKGWTVA